MRGLQRCGLPDRKMLPVPGGANVIDAVERRIAASFHSARSGLRPPSTVNGPGIPLQTIEGDTVLFPPRKGGGFHLSEGAGEKRFVVLSADRHETVVGIGLAVLPQGPQRPGIGGCSRSGSDRSKKKGAEAPFPRNRQIELVVLRTFRILDESSVGRDDIAIKVLRLGFHAGVRTVGSPVLRVGPDCVGTALGIREEDVPTTPSVLHGEGLDVRRRDVRRQSRDRRQTTGIEAVIRTICTDSRCNGPHVGHGPLLATTIDRVEKIRNRDGRDDTDDRHDDQQLDESETFLSAHCYFPPFNAVIWILQASCQVLTVFDIGFRPLYGRSPERI